MTPYKYSLKKTITFLIILISFPLWAQIGILKDMPFKSGEKITYSAIYKWGLIELDAGRVEFSVDSLVKDQQAAYLFKSTGISMPKYDWIYKVRDTFYSYALVKNLQPIYYERHTSEGDYKVQNRSFFHKESERIILHLNNSDDGFRTKNIKWKKGLFDLQTAVYYARMLDAEKAQIGDTYDIDVIIDGEVFVITILYEGKEDITLSNKKTLVGKVRAELLE
ncbi:MAG: hypothetical protein B7C24_12155 [Bacteroidetes bacterium 4572_77]|nr:MAG: hypothetical protein B7C24_12155 [Bacteroidetes bacterium 4572_77]